MAKSVMTKSISLVSSFSPFSYSLFKNLSSSTPLTAVKTSGPEAAKISLNISLKSLTSSRIKIL